MLKELGYESMDQFVSDTVPESIRIDPKLISDDTIPPFSEADLLREAKQIGAKNLPFRSYIGMGYHTAVVPTPIMRSVSIPLMPQLIHLSRFFLDNGGTFLVYTIYPVPTRNRSR
jgi:glycine cleavage system pyridoxal-binding protein P